MSTAETILANELGDVRLTVNLNTRTITIPDSIKNIGVESDDEVFRLPFSIPRFFGEFDLSQFKLRINYLNAKSEGDMYEPEDVEILDQELTFSWLIGRHAYTKAGNVEFNVCLKKYSTENPSEVVKEFNTTPSSLPVLKGLETTEWITSEYIDILEQWRRDIMDEVTNYVPDGGTSNVVTDDTLTVAGAAADAKITGDKLTSLEADATNANLLATVAMPGSVKFDGDIDGRYYIPTIDNNNDDGLRIIIGLVHMTSEIPSLIEQVIASGILDWENTPIGGSLELPCVVSVGGMEGTGALEGMLVKSSEYTISAAPVLANGEIDTSDEELMSAVIVLKEGVSFNGSPVFEKRGVYGMFYNMGYELPTGSVMNSLMHISGLYIHGYPFKDSGSSNYFETKSGELVETKVGDTLTWDGNTSDRLYETASNTNTDGEKIVIRVVLMSTDFITKDEIATVSGIKASFINGSETIEGTSDAGDLKLYPSSNDDSWTIGINKSGSEGNASSLVCFGIPADNFDFDGILLPKRGIYFISGTNGTETERSHSVTIPGYNLTDARIDNSTVIKQEHLPQALQFGGSGKVLYDKTFDIILAEQEVSSDPVYADEQFGAVIKNGELYDITIDGVTYHDMSIMHEEEITPDGSDVPMKVSYIIIPHRHAGCSGITLMFSDTNIFVFQPDKLDTDWTNIHFTIAEGMKRIDERYVPGIPFVVTIVLDISNGTSTSDHTHTEIKNAFRAGRSVIAVINYVDMYFQTADVSSREYDTVISQVVPSKTSGSWSATPSMRFTITDEGCTCELFD